MSETEPTSRKQKLQHQAAAFLSAAAKMERPTDGDIADFMHDMPPKGLNACMRGIGEAIGSMQDIAMQGADKELLAHLRELCESRVVDESGEEKTFPYNPTDALLAAAFPGEEGITAADEQQLRDAFRHNGRSIFDEMLRILTDIAVNKKLEIEGGLDDMTGDDAPRKPRTDKPKGWRESLKSDDRPGVDDKTIRDAARQHDANQPPVSDKDIKKSAAGGDEFRIGDEHRSEYEKGEGKGDFHYLAGLHGEESELKQYYYLCKRLKAAFDSTLGPCLEPSGMTRARSEKQDS